MNIFDLLKLNPLELWNKITGGDIKPIPAKRWSMSINDVSFGNCVTSHTVGLDAVGTWAKWIATYDDDQEPATDPVTVTVQSWRTPSGKHIIKINDKDVEKDSVRVRLTTTGFPPKGVVIVIHRYVDSTDEAMAIRFDGRL